MDNPGVQTLAALEISGALSQSLLMPSQGAADLSGMSEVTLDVKFSYGSGSGTVSVIVVTSFDGASSLRQIARFDFANATETKYATLTKAPTGVLSYADLASEGVTNALLGNILGVLLTTTGVYSNSTLWVRASVS